MVGDKLAALTARAAVLLQASVCSAGEQLALKVDAVSDNVGGAASLDAAAAFPSELPRTLLSSPSA